jgi:hypothetical protein
VEISIKYFGLMKNQILITFEVQTSDGLSRHFPSSYFLVEATFMRMDSTSRDTN